MHSAFFRVTRQGMRSSSMAQLIGDQKAHPLQPAILVARQVDVGGCVFSIGDVVMNGDSVACLAQPHGLWSLVDSCNSSRQFDRGDDFLFVSFPSARQELLICACSGTVLLSCP